MTRWFACLVVGLLLAATAHANPNTYGGSGSSGSGSCVGAATSPYYCGAVRDANGDANIADDVQRVINELIFGASAAETNVYIEAPPPGHYYWNTQVVICADDTPPSGSDAPNCDGTTGVVPTIHWVGRWADSTMLCTVNKATTANTRRGCIVIGDAAWPSGTTIDGYAGADAAIASGEVRMEMESALNIVVIDDGDGYTGMAAPRPWECLGCRGTIRFNWADDGISSIALGPAYFGGQDLKAYLKAITSDTTYFANGASVRNSLTLIGPHKNSIIEFTGVNTPIAFDELGCIAGCGDVDLRVDMTFFDDQANGISIKAWDSPRISGTIHQRNGTSGTHSAAIEFEPDNNPNTHPMRLAHLGPLDIVSEGTSTRGAVLLKSCSSTISPIFEVADTRISIADGYLGFGGGIGARKEDNVACTVGHGDGEMPPIVKVSGYSFNSDESTNWAFAEDGTGDGSGDNDGIIISEAGTTYTWFTNDVADVAAGECLNFAQDSDGTDMHLPCTDERTMLRPSESTGLFVAWSRVDIGNDAIDAGEGCKLTPNYNGAADTDTDHILLSGDDANVEAVDTTASAYINRIVTAGQTLQFQLEDAAADNCTDHVGVRWSAHVIPLDSPVIDDAPFGDGQP